MPTCSGLYRSDACFEDADPNLDGLKLIKNTKRPVLIRQLKEVHGMKKRIDKIIKNAELRGEVYLDAEDKRWFSSHIWWRCSCPRTDTIRPVRYTQIFISNLRPEVDIRVPENLTSLLVDDWETITSKKSLVPLPAHYTVNEILTAYFEEGRAV